MWTHLYHLEKYIICNIICFIIFWNIYRLKHRQEVTFEASEQRPGDED